MLLCGSGLNGEVESIMLPHQDDEILAKFEESLSQRALASSTIVNYLADLRAFRRWARQQVSPGFSLVNINQEHVRQYRTHLAKELERAPSTTNRHIMALRKFFMFATELNIVSADPTAGVALLAEAQQPAADVLAENDVEKLLLAAQNGSRAGLVRRDVAILQLLLRTGLRVSEVVELQKTDLVFDNPGVHLQVSSGQNHSRRLPVPGELCKVLVDYLNFRPQTSSPHFFLNQDGGPISKRTVQRIVSDCAKTAGVDGVSPQMLRRTFARQLYEKTQDLALVSKRLGHQNTAITEQYLSL